MTFYDKRFPQLGKATSKTALTTTMISGSSAAGEPLPPHFQFQTSAQTAEAGYIRIECIRRSIGDGTDEQQAMALLIQEHNAMACAALSLAGYNGDIMKLELKPAASSTSVVTVAHSQDRIELLSQAKSHGNIFSATGGDHLTSNDMFKSITLTK